MFPIKNDGSFLKEFQKFQQATNKSKDTKTRHSFSEYKGKKSGKEYLEYINDCKRKQELLIKQKLEENSSINIPVSSPGIDVKPKLEKMNTVTSLPEDMLIDTFWKCDSKKKESIVREPTHGNGLPTSITQATDFSKTILKKPGKVTEDPDEVTVPDDPNVLIAIEHLVSQISLLPGNLQRQYIKNFEDQEEYWFLTVGNTMEFNYFQWRLQQANEDRLRIIEKSSIAPKIESDTSKKRKSRWGNDPPNPSVIIPVVIPGVQQQRLTENQKEQMQYQKELQAMQEFIVAQQKAKQKEQELMNSIDGIKYRPPNPKQGRFKYEYDSDEDIDGGTWEHKLRQSEMEATRDWADKLNEMGQGKHHIGDFLPPEELMRFMNTFKV